LANVQGKSVLTLEGFRDTEKYKLLEQCFGEAGAVQCGFCTPGMIMAAEALLRKNPHPQEDEIREAISGNLCRCTGYNMIIAAVRMAAEKGAGLW
jgi:carbon-monoxide dehydrogenase small subunit